MASKKLSIDTIWHIAVLLLQLHIISAVELSETSLPELGNQETCTLHDGEPSEHDDCCCPYKEQREEPNQ